MIEFESLKIKCDERIFDKNYMISLSLDKEFRDSVVLNTSWLPEKTPLKIRCLAINKNYNENNFPRCVCGNLVTYEKEHQNKFIQYCGVVCSRTNNQKLSFNTKDKLSDKSWLENKRIKEKRSYEEIATELNCSVTPVVKACKKHNILEIKLNQSQPITNAFLRNKEWLTQKHCVERKTLQEIADEIGSTKSTLSRWLEFHEIIANNSNSYDRKINKTSLEEVEVLDYVKSLCPEEDIISSNRTILNGQELDIYIPNKKIAIEYNGIYSHIFRPENSSEAGRKDRNYHFNKTKICRENDITLFHIFSDDWIYKKTIWKSILRAKLGCVEEKIFARKCIIKEISRTEKKYFLETNHLQGNDKSTIAYGLYFEGILVCIMTFSKSRYNTKYDWELQRFCGKLDTSIVGGFSKLLYFFRTHHPGSIISYADLSRSSGEVYEKNGFSLLKINGPSYAYVNLKDGIIRKHRSNFTKSKLKETKENHLTEYEIMKNRGYDKIFDCGTATYVI